MLIEKKIINNPHRVNYCLAPDIDFNSKMTRKFKKKLMKNQKIYQQKTKGE